MREEREIVSGNETYRLKKMAKLAGNGRVLDIGCSDMPNHHIEAQRLVGADLYEGNLSENYHAMIVADVYDFPEGLNGEKFDTIVIGEVLEHVTDSVLFLKKCVSVLNAGGQIVLSTPNPHSPIELILNITLNRKWYYTKYHVTLYPQRWLIRVMELAGLSDVKLHSGGMLFPFVSKGKFPFVGLLPFPRAFCYQTIAVGIFKGEK